MAVGFAEAALEKVDRLSEQQYCVVMHEHRDPETDSPLFWSSSKQWVSLRDADVFALRNETVLKELLDARFPRESYGFVELPASGNVISLS